MRFTLRQPFALMLIYHQTWWVAFPLISFGGVGSRPLEYLADGGFIGFRAHSWECLGVCLNVNWGERDLALSLTFGFIIGSVTFDLGDLTLIPEYCSR